MALDHTPNTQRLTAYAGTGERNAYFDSNGNLYAENLGSTINKATAKNTPVDADMVGLMDSAASNILKKLSWSNIKATLKTYFDTLYGAFNGGTITGDLTIEKDSAAFNIIPSGGTIGEQGFEFYTSDAADPNPFLLIAYSATNKMILESLSGSNTFYSVGPLLRVLGHNQKVIQAVTAVASSFTHNSASYNAGKISAQDVDFTMNAPTGSPADMETFTFYVRSNTAGVEITWNAAFRSLGATLPTAALTANKWYSMIFMYNSTDSKWDLMSLAIEP